MKNQFIQSAKGLSIILVVLIHCKSGIGFDYGTITCNSYIILRQIINFSVPLFFFLSGYCTDLCKISKKHIFGRLSRLLIPYLIWSSLYILNRARHTDLSFGSVLQMLLTGSSSAQLYFIIVLAQLTILLPLIKIAHKSLIGRCIILGISLSSYIAIYATGFKLPCKGYIFSTWLIFYYIGIYVKDKGLNNLIKLKYSPVIVTLIISICEAFCLNAIYKDYNIAATHMCLSNMLYSFAVINLVLQEINKASNNSGFLSKIGDCSYGIFYIHMFVLMIVVRIIDFIPLGIPALLYTFIPGAAIIALSYIIVAVSQKLLNKKINTYIGFN